jgi:hypothetical protein
LNIEYWRFRKKSLFPFFCRSGESRARSEALALFSKINISWMPPHRGAGQAYQVRHDDSGIFYETINIGI